MRNEIEAAARWFANTLRSKDLSNEQLVKFEAALAQLLTIKYTNHWYATMPWRGQGYRSIITDEYSIDKVLKKAARVADIRDLHKRMPKESFVMWVDPGEVEVKYLRTSRSEVVYSSSATAQQHHQHGSSTMGASTASTMTRPGFSFPTSTTGVWQQQESGDVHRRGNSFAGSASARILDDLYPGQESGMKLPSRSATPTPADRHDRLGLYSSNSTQAFSRLVKDSPNAKTTNASIWDRSGISSTAVGASTTTMTKATTPTGSASSSSSKLNLHARPFVAKTSEWANVVKNVKNT